MTEILNNIDKFIAEELKKIFPDKIISKISNYPIYSDINKECNSRNIDIRQYIESLGFSYINKQSDLFTAENIIQELLFLFPNRQYEKINNIRDYNQSLYVFINNQAKAESKKTVEYLKKLGFSKAPANKIQYDLYNFEKLLSAFSIQEADFARIFDCSRENIRQKKRKNKTENKNAWLIPITDDEINFILKNVNNNHLTFYSSEFSYIIIDNLHSTSNKALLLRNNNIIKVSYVLPDKIQQLIQKKFLDIFSTEEIEFFSYLNKLWDTQGSVMSGNLKLVNLESTDKIKIKKWASNKSLDINEYLALIDFIYLDNRFVSENDIISKIQLYADVNNNINLKVTDTDYNFFATCASRKKKMSIYDFFESYGFHYKRGHYVGNVFEKHQNIISKRYIVNDNVIYIPSYDPYYRTLTGFAFNKNMSIDEILISMGYNRIANKRDLPAEYIPYDYSNALKESSILDTDKIAVALSMLSNENNEVYIDISSYLYYILFLQAKLRNINITDTIMDYGYLRIMNPDNIEELKSKYNDIDDILEYHEEDYIKNKLKDLIDLESHYSIQIHNSEKIERNQKLVSLLKDMYQCKCQLCTPEITFPPICREDGSIYSEVHHITSLHEATSEVDIKYIDSYKNTIVLCPYHHKYVHIHNGGFTKLYKDDNDILYLENEHKEYIEIYTNYHLSI